MTGSGRTRSQEQVWARSFGPVDNGGSRVNGADATGLLERWHELATLETLVDAAVAGEARVGLIEGAAGIGRSRLLTEARRRAAVAGVRILRARGGALEREFAFGVVAPTLRACAGGKR